MNLRNFASLLRDSAVNWMRDYAQSMGAALAFYTMFSIAPLLLIVIAVAGLIVGEDAAKGEIYLQLQGLLGSPGAAAVQDLLEHAGRRTDNLPAAAAGLVILFIGATSVFAELQDALDRIWRAPAKPAFTGWRGFIRVRVLSFGMILGIGFLLMVSLALSAGMAALSRWWIPLFGGWETVAYLIDLAASVALSATVFAVIYKAMPRVRVAWADVWIGAGFTALLFLAGKFLIGAYIGTSGISSWFGAAASLVVVLLWVYYSAQIFLFGAEFTWVYSHRFGSRKEQALPGLPLPAP